MHLLQTVCFYQKNIRVNNRHDSCFYTKFTKLDYTQNALRPESIFLSFHSFFSCGFQTWRYCAQFVATLSFFLLTIKHQTFMLLCDVFVACVVAQCTQYRTVRRRELFVCFSWPSIIKYSCCCVMYLLCVLSPNVRHTERWEEESCFFVLFFVLSCFTFSTGLKRMRKVSGPLIYYLVLSFPVYLPALLYFISVSQINKIACL